jgi:hypothetical protein
MCATVVEQALHVCPANPGTASHVILSLSHPLHPPNRLHPPRTSSLDSSSTPDRHTNRRRDRLQHRPFVAAGGTCPDPVVEVLAGSTCPVVDLADRTAPAVDHIGPGEVRSPGLAADMGWASRTGWAAAGCNNLELATDRHRKPAGVAEGRLGIEAVGRPERMLAKVDLCSFIWARCCGAACGLICNASRRHAQRANVRISEPLRVIWR